MTVHSLLVGTRSGEVLLAKYYQELSTEQKADFSQKLYENTSPFWEDAMITEQVACFDAFSCVFIQINQVLIFLTGFGDDDEIILLTCLRTLVEVFSRVVFKKSISIQTFHESYPKASLAIHELIQQGHIQQLDAESVNRILKLKGGAA
ncbi:hypothetical protein PAPYR_5445 [Paratrimastix pyriformis]|uniref:Coatomer subunit zeta n=1 Tax=Paratrimastix pyriformis TaxID=342808 RepID=A0ABQ8UL76_9EUKA|nr:hypothetical protein PAPYR_5445 [Paratrimastix pyriformis]